MRASPSRHRLVLPAAAGLLLAWGALAGCRGGGRAAADGGGTAPPGTVAGVKVDLAGADKTVALERQADGTLLFVLRHDDGAVERLSPQAFAERVYGEQAWRPFWQRFLNITTPLGLAWVALGLLGQVLFTGRMLLQWAVSEKHRRSVVPTGFWWMSLGGASMLVVYFVWRKDLIGVLGQTTGWLIYLRNLWLIYFPSRPAEAG